MTATTNARRQTAVRDVRIAVVGAGFAGLGLAVRLRQHGMDDFVVFEKADEVGGTWRDNTYPGAQCDVPSNLYSFSFAPNPTWSRTYSEQAEILDYLRGVTERFHVRPHIRFRHQVRRAEWDEAAQRWRIETSNGTWLARVLVLGHGGLSEPSVPALPGLETFAGPVFHSAEWDHGCDVTGKRVAVVGTGASAVQIVPRLQPDAQQLDVYQRTAPWVLPHTDRATTRLERTLYRRAPVTQRFMRGLAYGLREVVFLAFAKPSWLTGRVERLARAHLRRQVRDSQLRRKLTPDYAPGCKRLLLSNDYYPALTKPNVELVTDGISEVRERSIVTREGRERPVDVIIMATGFKVTNHPMLDVVFGRDGRSLGDVWSESGMQAYLGTTVAGFPNAFVLSGPNTGIGHTSLVFMIEAQIAYLVDALRKMARHGVGTVEVRRDVVAAFNADLQRRMAPTVWAAGGCASWYLDASGRNTTLWPDFTWKYRLRTRRFDLDSYVAAPVRPAQTPASAAS